MMLKAGCGTLSRPTGYGPIYKLITILTQIWGNEKNKGAVQTEHYERLPEFDRIKEKAEARIEEERQAFSDDGQNQGASPIGTQLPDEKFIQMLESTLHQPIYFTMEELEDRYSKPKLKVELDQWMRGKGWVIVSDPEGVRDNLERAAKYACYALVNKLVFHEAVLKRYGGKMTKLSAPSHIDQGEKLRLHLERHFQEAKKVTDDYETVFGEDHTGIGNRIPFYSDKAVPHWQTLIGQIHAFDFSLLDYDVIGSIFERLLSPAERKKYGQFYTRPEVVDLINSFCIHRGNEKVMDPACGGGTFLVRAYARKHEQDPSRAH